MASKASHAKLDAARPTPMAFAETYMGGVTWIW